MAAGTDPAYHTIHDLADDERPRERLLRHGPEILSDADLVAIIVGSGTAGQNVVELARNLLESHGGLAGLLRTDSKALQRTRGLGPAKAAQLAAALELGRRLQTLDTGARPNLSSPEAVFAYLSGHFLGRAKEEFHVLSLDRGGRLLGTPPVLRGGVHSVSLRFSQVFREPVVLEATAVLFAHNHPSGRPSPSARDIEVTGGLAAAGDLLGIPVRDHLVIAQDRFVSMKREGLLNS